MKNIAGILLLWVSCFALPSEAGWDVFIHDNEWATLSDNHQRRSSLSEAVAAVPKDIWLRNFRVLLSKDDLVLQKELHEFLSSNYPELHAGTLSSAGNMHNPKVVALREPIKQALLASSLAKEIRIALASRCERIASTSFEKFTIWKEDDQLIYSAMVWLSTEKCT